MAKSDPVSQILKYSGKPSATEAKLLSTIKDPEQRAIQKLQMEQQAQALLCTTLTNLMMMRYEMQKSCANNLRF